MVLQVHFIDKHRADARNKVISAEKHFIFFNFRLNVYVAFSKGFIEKK